MMDRRSFPLELRAARLRSFLSGKSRKLAELIERLGAPWQGEIERLGEEAQRFGGQAWKKITERWPALAELLREHNRVRARYRPQRAAGTTSARSRPEQADALIAQLMAASSWQTRAGAALSLAHHAGDEVVSALLRALRDPSVEVAVAAVDALAGQRGDVATQGLLGVLQNPDGYFSPVTRVAAVSALAQRLGPEGFAPIIAAVRDIDAEVSIAAAAVITERMPAEAAAHLLPVLRDESGYYLPVVRLALANALERAGLLHGGVTRDLLASERDPAVRRVLERASHLTGEVSAE